MISCQHSTRIQSFSNTLRAVFFIVFAFNCTNSEAFQLSDKASAPSSWASMPSPPINLDLMYDPAFKEIIEDSSRSMDWYKTKTEERKRLKEKGLEDEFSIPELKVTLQNIRLMILHIFSGSQFAEPIEYLEQIAYSQMLLRIDELLRQEKPSYIKTIREIIAFNLIYDFSVYEKVTAPLLDALSVKESEKRISGYNSNSSCKRTDIPSYPLIMAEYKEPVNSLYYLYNFQKNNLLPTEEFTHECDPMHLSDIRDHIKNTDIILYPSFNEMDLDDFVNIAHIPLYPVGLMNQYAINADGALNTPWMFMAHDIRHTKIHASYKYISGSGYLESIESRHSFITAAVSGAKEHFQSSPGIEKSIMLFLFDAFHEFNFNYTKGFLRLDKHSFNSVNNILGSQQTVEAYHFSPKYNSMTEDELKMGLIWVTQLYNYWKGRNGEQLTQKDTERFHKYLFLPIVDKGIGNYEDELPEKLYEQAN